MKPPGQFSRSGFSSIARGAVLAVTTRTLLMFLCACMAACSPGNYGPLPEDSGPSTAATGDPDGGLPPDSGLPCDVATLLTSHCIGCHASPPANGAPVSLDSLTALRASSNSDPARSNAELSVIRMSSPTSPMPPAPAAGVPSSGQAMFSAWVSAGTPAGSCGTGSDGGTDGGVDPVFAGPDTCTSGSYYQGGEGSQMNPGLACIACHSRGEGPRFAVAGTVYPTGHEYDDCNAPAAAGAVVEVTDSAGVTHSMTASSVGNFSSSGGSGWPRFPIRARVLFQGRVRVMAGAVPSGDCNSCHTLRGDQGAPGRIALP